MNSTITPFVFGTVIGSIHDFKDVGDILPMHTHTEANNHISIVAKGSFKVHGDGWEKTIVAGNVVDWPVGKAHEFNALEPNSRLVNIQKGGA
jgi:quercetin dioxygenase-like cupin family protein